MKGLPGVSRARPKKSLSQRGKCSRGEKKKKKLERALDWIHCQNSDSAFSSASGEGRGRKGWSGGGHENRWASYLRGAEKSTAFRSGCCGGASLAIGKEK